jgi:elongation factor 3
MTKITLDSPVQEIINYGKGSPSIESLENLFNAYKGKIETIDKKDQSGTVNALKAITEIAKANIPSVQACLLNVLPPILAACGDKKSSSETRKSAEEAVIAIAKHISPNALREILPHLYAALDSSCKWQTRVAALNAIASFGDHAPEQLSHSMPDVMPEVSKCVVELKQEVCDAAEKALVAVCEVVGNR